MAKKSKRILIRMNSSAGTGYFYTTTKNPQNTTGKLKLKKYDPVAGEYVEFTEGKIK